MALGGTLPVAFAGVAFLLTLALALAAGAGTSIGFGAGHVTRTAGARRGYRRADLGYGDVAQDRVRHQVGGGGRGGRGHYVQGWFLDVVRPGLRTIGGVCGGGGG